MIFIKVLQWLHDLVRIEPDLTLQGQSSDRDLPRTFVP